MLVTRELWIQPLSGYQTDNFFYQCLQNYWHGTNIENRNSDTHLHHWSFGSVIQKALIQSTAKPQACSEGSKHKQPLYFCNDRVTLYCPLWAQKRVHSPTTPGPLLHLPQWSPPLRRSAHLDCLPCSCILLSLFWSLVLSVSQHILHSHQSLWFWLAKLTRKEQWNISVTFLIKSFWPFQVGAHLTHIQPWSRHYKSSSCTVK